MSQNLLTLMTTAAELRTGGMSWEYVGQKVHRKAGTCSKWPSRYRRDWNRIYMDAQRQRYEEVSNESLTYLRSLLRSKDDKTKLKSIEMTLRYGPAAIAALTEGLGAKNPEDEDKYEKWLRYQAGEDDWRQRIDRERARKGLPQATDAEFYAEWTVKLEEIQNPKILNLYFDANGCPIERPAGEPEYISKAEYDARMAKGWVKHENGNHTPAEWVRSTPPSGKEPPHPDPVAHPRSGGEGGRAGMIAIGVLVLAGATLLALGLGLARLGAGEKVDSHRAPAARSNGEFGDPGIRQSAQARREEIDYNPPSQSLVSSDPACYLPPCGNSSGALYRRWADPMRKISSLALPLILLSFSNAEKPAEKGKDPVPEALPRIAPRTPEESAKLFEIHPDFRVELAVAEPLVMSPVAAEFDEDGRLLVVELPEYNQYGSAKPHGKGRVVMLEDTDGEGKFTKRTIVASDLDYPTAVFPWDGGVIVGAAPDLIYVKNGEKKVLLRGFGKDKAGEGQLNSFRWSLENKILISTGIDGGEILPGEAKEPATVKDVNLFGSKPVNVRSLNILFDPRTGTFETTSGGGQHGMTLDDWGNTFTCGNSDPCHHLVYDVRHLAKNPAVQAPPPAAYIAPGGKFTKLHRISEVEPWRALRTKLRKDGTVPGSDEGGAPSGFFTGATGITVYRGDAYPEEFRGNAFVGEVANNLVFRAKLVSKGVSFVAERADKDKEFLASKDIWFRPVQFLQGPDGCLYVIDMYRELIEGAAFLAPPILKNVDPSAGVDKGRIWRIVPKDFKRPKPPKLSTATTEELVKLLEHPDGWHRDTAARLLYQRQDEKALPLLKKMTTESKSPLGRMHALAVLVGLKKLMYADLEPLQRDADPHVRRFALQTANRRQIVLGDRDYQRLAKDDDAGVRCELVWAIAGVDGNVVVDIEAVGSALRSVVGRDHADPWVRLAVTVAATGSNAYLGTLDFIDNAELRKSQEGRAFIESLVETAGASTNRNVAMAALRGISRLRDQEVGFQLHLFGVLLRRVSPENFSYLQKNPTAIALFEQLHERATEVAFDSRSHEAERAQAIRAMVAMKFDKVREVVAMALKPNQPRSVQVAALELLGRIGNEETPAMIVKVWPTLSPQVRATATEVFLSRANWMQSFFEAVEARKIARGDIDPARVALLLKSPNRSVRLQSQELFKTTAPTQRKDVIATYQKSLMLKGDAIKGKLIFKKDCSACHKLEDVGNEVGADLKAIRDRGTENTLLNILDPNREVKPQYLAYTLETASGKSYSGMIAAETPNSVTIRMLDGRSETVQRGDIASLRSTGLSFMPEGLEKQIDVQAMADLLAYLNSIK